MNGFSDDEEEEHSRQIHLKKEEAERQLVDAKARQKVAALTTNNLKRHDDFDDEDTFNDVNVPEIDGIIKYVQTYISLLSSSFCLPSF